MQIIDYRVTPIAFGDPPLLSAFGLHAPYALRTIIELVSDDGITGISETHGGNAVVADLELAVIWCWGVTRSSLPPARIIVCRW